MELHVSPSPSPSIPVFKWGKTKGGLGVDAKDFCHFELEFGRYIWKQNSFSSWIQEPPAFEKKIPVCT